MGNVFGKCCGNTQTRKRIVLLLIGLDNAGKTKTVNHLMGSGDHEVLPTVGFKAVNLVHRKNPVIIYDLGGGPHFRAIWSQYYSDVHGVIFVVDSTDHARLEECKDVLQDVLSHEKIAGKPVLILANKQDIEGAMDDLDIVERLDIESVVNRFRCPTRVESYTTVIPEGRSKRKCIDPGLHKGYYWLLNYIIHRYGDLNLRVHTDMNSALEKRKQQQMRDSGGTNGQPHNVDSLFTTQIPTSFENPNYKLNTTIGDEIQNNVSSQDGVIVVKQATKNKSIDSSDYDLIEHEHSNGRAGIRLSPLFGQSSTDSVDDKPVIELEARNHIRKLSPIVRKKFNVSANIESPMKKSIDLNETRPHSSPVRNNDSRELQITRMGNKVDCLELDVRDDGDSSMSTVSTARSRLVEVSLAGSDPERRESGKLVLPPIQKAVHSARDVGPSHAVTTEAGCGRGTSQSAPRRAPTNEPARPHSASYIVRKQLELEATQQKRKLSLKSLRLHRTSPEGSLFIYEPRNKLPPGQGDCNTDVVM